jgi:hypothetical protein
MNSFPAALTGVESEVEAAAKPAGWWERIEAVLDRASEWLNPILVKEARQALKSRQFVITFGLLLLCGWAWTLFGVFLAAPGIFYGAEGKGMLYGYFLVLAIPLLVVVPFSAFRSLAAEREDGTYELISITALHARQIVSGKLGSAVLQMMVYFSALAPCVAFTYLLRGVDIFSIFFVLYYTFLLSLMLSTLSLLVATATRARHWQVLLSVLLLLVLFLSAWGWVVFIHVSLGEEIWRADQWQFWAANGFVLSLYVSFFLLFLWASGAQISFPSDNRSTRLRYVMAAQQLLWIGWMSYFWVTFQEPEVAALMLSFAAIYWMGMGALLSGEYPQLSPRVRRELPQSLLGRMLLTWFNPGSGTGYVFAVLNMAALTMTTMAIVLWFNIIDPNWNQFRVFHVVWYSVMLTAYVTAYLGISRLVLLLARQIATVGLVFSLLINIFFAIAGTALPWLLQYWLFNFRQEDYTSLQITNWFWTLVVTASYDITDHPIVPIGVIGGAAVIFLMNLLLSSREIAQTRVAAPQRVQQDEAAQLPAFKPRKSSPWDDEEPGLDLPPGV